MNRSFSILVLLLLITSTSVYAKDKTRFGGQVGFPLYTVVFMQVPLSDQSLIQLEVGSLLGISTILGAKYRRQFSADNSRSFWEIGAFNTDAFSFLGINIPSGTVAQISVNTYLSKGEHGGWVASMIGLSGSGGTRLVPNISYEYVF
ncbi:MAG: hypothetical protein V3S12_05780 [Acidiferrobacterales bacterium]